MSLKCSIDVYKVQIVPCLSMYKVQIAPCLDMYLVINKCITATIL